MSRETHIRFCEGVGVKFPCVTHPFEFPCINYQLNVIVRRVIILIMYPANYFALFPSFPYDSTIFVAMSFADEFKPRWNNVILPVIQNLRWNDKPITPIRVDQRTINDSILTEILGGIGRSLLVVADITTIFKIGKKAVRNSNVMYEVGIAHAQRLPPEVILFRSDNDELLFDTSNVRVNTYDPDNNRGDAIQKLDAAIKNASREIDLQRQAAVERAALRLDVIAYSFLQKAIVEPIQPPDDVLAGIPATVRLLEQGLLEVTYNEITTELFQQAPDMQMKHFFRYRPTPFGRAVHNYIIGSTKIIKLIQDAAKAGQTFEQYHAQLRSQLATVEPSIPIASQPSSPST